MTRLLDDKTHPDVDDKTDPKDGDWVDVDRSELQESVGQTLRDRIPGSTWQPRSGLRGGPRQFSGHSGPRGQASSEAPASAATRDIMLEAGRAYVALLEQGCRFWSQIVQAGAHAFGTALGASTEGRRDSSARPPDASAAGFEHMLRLMAELKEWKQDWVVDRAGDVRSSSRRDPDEWRRRSKAKP